MPNGATELPDPPGRASGSGWLVPALAIVGAITAARVVLLAFSRVDLFVDEAQYWLWGQDIAWGYYSKPPLIAWVIRGATDLAGSDAPFWIRLPAPLFHAATALILGTVAARLAGPRTAIAVAAAYATLPMVAVGSLLISTDTIMFPFLAGALAGYLALLDAREAGGRRPWLALATGLALGLAFLGKYAAVFPLALAILAALRPGLRPAPGDALLALAGFAAMAAPNLAWNAANGLATLSHTVDNTGWRGGLSLDPLGMLRFLGEQALVFGPILLPALVLAAATLREPRRAGLLALLSLPVVGLIALQALVSGANANWAASAYLAGTVLAVAWLVRRPRWLAASFVLNGAVALALPLLATRADTLRWGDRLVFARYVGLDELSRQILDLAESEGARAVAANERAVLADLFHTGRDGRVPIYAWPHDGPPRNHYEQRHAYTGGADGPVLAVSRGRGTPPCTSLRSGTLVPGPGAYARTPFTWWLVAPDCWEGRS